MRDGMWGFLLFSGVAWLAIAWSVLRLEPVDIVNVAGPVILFGAATEVLRALAGTRTWWLNAGMAVLFTATGLILMMDSGSTWTSPAALIGWYLMVRGAADLAISMMTRETDRIWGLLTVLGVAELALGFFAASSYARTAEVIVLVLGATALLRGTADLVASMRLREVSVAMDDDRVLQLTPERAIGVAGYSAGLTDFEAGSPPRGARPRHRAATTAVPDVSAPGGTGPLEPQPQTAAPLPPAAWEASQDPSARPPDSFHDEVLRTTADLDAMLAQAGVTGAIMPGPAAQAAAEERVEVPDTAEGAELPDPHEAADAAAEVAHRQVAAEMDDSTLPLLDSAARAAETAAPGPDDTAIIAKRWVD
ncbi:DUF308 domain-containing protein [Actinoplanes sp. NPDC026623]|uniref:HdeD family acid-resistance protein n=1 Tax=Actinoplanes sp. NPDC026623 TaxID=3155610 RepID=UPI0033DF7C1B